MVPPLGSPVTARAAALEALRRAEAPDLFLQDALHAVFAETDLAPRDRALATQLAAGTMRHRRTLRLVVSHVRGKGRRASSIQPALLAILELAAFQLLFLDRVPDYAAVNEAVEAARATARSAGAARKTAGFVNGVLRGIGRLVRGHEPEGVPGREALPHPERGVVRLAEPVLPDPRTDRDAFLGEAYSLPDWLVQRWLTTYGKRTESICAASNRRPRTIARVNPMKQEARARLEEAGLDPEGDAVDVSPLAPAELAALLDEGVVTVQDRSAMEAVRLLEARPGERVLDLCAAPGTKTTQIVEAMGDEGTVLACDRDEGKLAPVRDVAVARGFASVRCCPAADLAALVPEGGFDAALVDAPCSNTGVLARRVEARWRLRPKDVVELAAIQSELLARAADLVRPGGRLVYSTCSLEPEENGGVIDRFLARADGWREVRREAILPTHDHDGAFVARLERGIATVLAGGA